jgi:predicted RNA binding protein YcfA (HicA-like mRNA interferase family)
MKTREIEKLLVAEGCRFVRNGGSHVIYQKGRERFVLSNSSRDHVPNLIKKMIKRARMASWDDVQPQQQAQEAA